MKGTRRMHKRTRRRTEGRTSGERERRTWTRTCFLPPGFHRLPYRRMEVRKIGRVGSEEGVRRRNEEEKASFESKASSLLRCPSNLIRSNAWTSFSSPSLSKEERWDLRVSTRRDQKRHPASLPPSSPCRFLFDPSACPFEKRKEEGALQAQASVVSSMGVSSLPFCIPPWKPGVEVSSSSPTSTSTPRRRATCARVSLSL